MSNGVNFMKLMVDINCDMGEGFGAYKINEDEAILPYITSANIACGFHAGDPAIMRQTVQSALKFNVAIGAHPGLPDLNGFGRRFMDITPQEAYEIVIYQIGALNAFVQAEGGRVQHVKAHGALYLMAAKNRELSEAIAEAVYRVDPELILFGLANSELVKAGQRIGLRTGSEVFADRTYQNDGMLTSRQRSDALIDDVDLAAQQVVRMVKEGKVRTRQNNDISILAETICIHGDGQHALSFAQKIRTVLERENIEIKSIGLFK